MEVCRVEHDVIPFGSVKGERARLAGLNIIGMRRRGFSRQELDDLRAGYKKLFSGKDNFQDRVAGLLSDKTQTKALKEVIDFIQQILVERSVSRRMIDSAMETNLCVIAGGEFYRVK